MNTIECLRVTFSNYQVSCQATSSLAGLLTNEYNFRKAQDIISFFSLPTKDKISVQPKLVLLQSYV